MLISILTFLAGIVAGPALMLFIARRMKSAAAPAAPVQPTRDQLIETLEHLRDRMRAIETASDQKVICEIARRAQVRAENTLEARETPMPEHQMPDVNRLARLRTRIGDYDNPHMVRDILDKMIDKAAKERDYAAAFAKWLEDGSTTELRTLAEPFGDYWKDLEYSNIVDTIDSAFLHIDEDQKVI